MKKKRQERIQYYKTQKKVGEEIQSVLKINGTLRIALLLCAAIGIFIVGRIFVDRIYILMLTNLLSMWMMVDVARTLIYIQDSCILITNKRIYGKINQRDINIFYRNIKQTYCNGKGIYIDGGNPHDSVLIRYISDKETVYQMIEELRNKK